MAYVKRTCEGCGSQFELRPGKNGRIYHAKRHCGRSCWLRRYNREDTLHTLKGARAGAEWNKRQRGTGTRWYVKEDQKHQHRVIAERVLGRQLQPGEVVHHEDLNKKNNTLTNLIVFPSHGIHMRHYHRCINRSQSCQCDCIRLHEVEGGDAQ